MAGCPGWDSVNPLCRGEQLIGGAAKSLGTDVFASIARYFAEVANSAVSWLWQQLNTATAVDLNSHSVQTDLLATGAIAALVTFALFLIQLIASVLRQEPGGLGRGVRGLGVAFIGAAFAIAATGILLTAVDGLANGVVQFALGTNINGLGAKLVAANTLAGIGNPAGLLLLSLVLIAAVVVIWVALMIRKMLIIVSAVFAPIAFSGAAADVSKSWVRRWIEFTVALVFSKLILVIIFMIGLTVLNDTGGASSTTPGSSGSAGSGGHVAASASITNLLVGALTLLLAGFAPWIAIKMVHFAGETFHAVHAQAAATTAGARTVLAAPQKVAAAASRVGGAVSPAAPAAAVAARPGTQPKPGSPGGPAGAGGAAGPAGSPGLGGGGAGRGTPPAGAPTASARPTLTGLDTAASRNGNGARPATPPDPFASS